MESTKYKSAYTNGVIDITKLIMAYLVIAIHTEPFAASFWLDKGFGLITRLCVPFFFVTSSYFFFLKKNNPFRYIKRLFLLYAVWSVLYLPFDLAALKEMSLPQILVKYFWAGNGHALWYLCGSIIGFTIVYGLSRILNEKQVFFISIVFLVLGCIKSTYAPVCEELFSITLPDYLGSRNGLFYAFPYYALGFLIAKKDISQNRPSAGNIIGFAAAFAVLCIESIVLVVKFETDLTILWLSVLPLTYNFFMIVKSMNVTIPKRQSYFMRKLSTLIYVSHCMFQYLFEDYLKLESWKLFLVVSVTATVFGTVIIILSEKRAFRWLKILY